MAVHHRFQSGGLEGVVRYVEGPGNIGDVTTSMFIFGRAELSRLLSAGRENRERERERENVVVGAIVFIEQKSSGAQSSHSLHNIVPSPASHRPSTNMICKCKISIFI